MSKRRLQATRQSGRECPLGRVGHPTARTVVQRCSEAPPPKRGNAKLRGSVRRVPSGLTTLVIVIAGSIPHEPPLEVPAATIAIDQVLERQVHRPPVEALLDEDRDDPVGKRVEVVLVVHRLGQVPVQRRPGDVVARRPALGTPPLSILALAQALLLQPLGA